MTISLRISEIISKILDYSVSTVSFDMPVEPSEKNFFIVHFLHFFVFLFFFFEDDDFGVSFDVDLVGEMDLDDLPDETQYDVFSLFEDELLSDIDHCAANRFG